MISQARRDPLHDPLLTPENCALLLIDYQAPRLLAVRSADSHLLITNAIALAETARHFDLPSIVTTMAADTAGEPNEMWPALKDALPSAVQVDRTSLNAWEDADVLSAIKASGRRKLVLGGLWTETCVSMTTLDALRGGFEVLVPVDAVGGTSLEAHLAGLARMFQLGAQPISCLGVLCELQRDWNRTETLAGTVSIGRRQSGAWPTESASRHPRGRARLSPSKSTGE